MREAYSAFEYRRARRKVPRAGRYAPDVPDRAIPVRPWWTLRSLLVVIVVIAACGAGTVASAPPPGAGLPAAATGLCDAIAAAPDAVAVERAFANEAHDLLHELAADPRLSRADAELVLQTMQQVEADFRAGAEIGLTTGDLVVLARSADAALAALGITVQPCEG